MHQRGGNGSWSTHLLHVGRQQRPGGQEHFPFVHHFSLTRSIVVGAWKKVVKGRLCHLLSTGGLHYNWRKMWGKNNSSQIKEIKTDHVSDISAWSLTCFLLLAEIRSMYWQAACSSSLSKLVDTHDDKHQRKHVFWDLTKAQCHSRRIMFLTWIITVECFQKSSAQV